MASNSLSKVEHGAALLGAGLGDAVPRAAIMVSKSIVGLEIQQELRTASFGGLEGWISLPCILGMCMLKMKLSKESDLST